MRTLRVLPLLLLGCGILTTPVEVDFTSSIDGAGLVGSLLGAVDFTGLDDFDVSVEQQIADQGADPGDLEEVRLTVFSLSADPDLSFLESLDVYVEAEGVPRTRVASARDFPEGQRTVELDLDDVNLADAVVAGAMTWSVDASGAAPVDDTDIAVHVEATVTATSQGACRAVKEQRQQDAG